MEKRPLIKVLLDEMEAYGHPKVRALNNKTLELTKETELTEEGDCILAVRATKSCADLSPKLKEAIQKGQKIRVELWANDIRDSFTGIGDPELPLTSKMSMVFRMSNFKCDRTILIKCTKAAFNIEQKIARFMQNSENRLKIKFYLLQ